MSRQFASLLSRKIGWPQLLNPPEPDLIVEAHEALEIKTARLASERASPQEIERIPVYREFSELTGRDFSAEIEIDLQFHETIAVASHNPLRASIMVGLREILRKRFYLVNQQTESTRATYTEDVAIFSSIATCHPGSAEEGSRRHTASGRTSLLQSVTSICWESSRE